MFTQLRSRRSQIGAVTGHFGGNQQFSGGTCIISRAIMTQADIRQELESFGVDVKSVVVLEKS